MVRHNPDMSAVRPENRRNGRNNPHMSGKGPKGGYSVVVLVVFSGRYGSMALASFCGVIDCSQM